MAVRRSSATDGLQRRSLRNLAVVIALVPILAASAVPVALARADGTAVLVIVEDGLPAGTPGASLRTTERRADSILLVRWLRACDRLSITSIPRDLVLDPYGSSLSVVDGTEGPGRVVALVERAFAVDISATVRLDVADVAELAGAVGPVEVSFRREVRDRRTGFHAGPGRVRLDTEATIAFLRSRTWEERFDAAWVRTSVSDEERIDRLQEFLRATLPSIVDGSAGHRLAMAWMVARHSSVGTRDAVAFLGFLAGASSLRGVTYSVAPVDDERPVDRRRSPFAPDDIGAGRRLVLARGAGPLLTGCADGTPAP
jgi:hypothetical protein